MADGLIALVQLLAIAGLVATLAYVLLPPLHGFSSLRTDHLSSFALADKLIAVIFLVGGAFGMIRALMQFGSGSAAGLSTSFLFIQVVVALYGGWLYWQRRKMGALMLYWLSWFCVPVFSSAALTYGSVIGIGVVPAVGIGSGNVVGEFLVRFAYASELKPSHPGLHIYIGVNVFALAVALFLRRRLRSQLMTTPPVLSAA